MAPNSSFPDKTDEGKDRQRLVSELQKLRESHARQAEVIARYERLNKDKKKPVADVFEELEIQRELVASLSRQLRETRGNFEVQKEEHEAAMGELRLGPEGRSKVEQALLESARELEDVNRQKNDILESISDCFYALDRDLRFVYVNKAAEEIWGLSRADLIGRKIDDVFTSLIDISMSKFRQVLKEQIPQHYEVYSKVIQRWGDMNVYPTRDGISVYFRDTTERKRAEEERERLLRDVEEQRGRLQAILDAIPVGVWVADAVGKLVMINDAAVNIWGGKPSEVNRVGEYFVYKIWRPDTGDRVSKEDYPIARALRGETIRGMVLDFERFDGTRGTQLASAAPIEDSRGNIIGGVAVALDITTFKRTEEELNVAKQQAELYLDLMGHDINNLHQIALGYLELARDMPPGERKDEFLDKPVEVLQRSAMLIKNVRKLQKLHDGVFRTEDIDMCKVLSDVRREFGANPAKTVTLNLNGHENCHVRSNELLHDVFANLVSNAIKHTGDKADIIVDMDVVKDNGNRYCRVMVEDDGPGISDGFKGKIFRRMLKSNNGTKGMGLGLYLVKSLVDSYGGRVWVEDRVLGDHSKGARFVVLLPVIEKVR